MKTFAPEFSALMTICVIDGAGDLDALIDAAGTANPPSAFRMQVRQGRKPASLRHQSASAGASLASQ